MNKISEKCPKCMLDSIIEKRGLYKCSICGLEIGTVIDDHEMMVDPDNDEPDKAVLGSVPEPNPMIHLDKLYFKLTSEVSNQYTDFIIKLKLDCKKSLKLQEQDTQDIVAEFSKFLSTFAMETQMGSKGKSRHSSEFKYQRCVIIEIVLQKQQFSQKFCDKIRSKLGAEDEDQIKEALQNIQQTKCDLVISLNQQDYLQKFIEHLGISKQALIPCLQVLEIVQKNNIYQGESPQSISSGIIIFVCQKKSINYDHKKLIEISELQNTTIKKYLTQLKDHEKFFIEI